MLDGGQLRQLDVDGFVHLPGFFHTALAACLRQEVERLFDLEGDAAGSEFRLEPGSRRLANMVDKGAIFRESIARPEILELVAHVIGPDYKLSSLNVRSANPHNGSPQPLHADVGAIADARGYWVCNTVWMIDDFTMENGALRVVPGSHNFGRLPQQALADPAAPHPDEILVTGKSGDVVVMNAHAWHGGTANRTDNHRRALHAFYCRRDKPQQQYQKRLLRMETQALLTPQLRWLLALDDEQNDSLCAGQTSMSGFLK
jgi:hypothetical protein